jgi:hypothetical protein
VEEVLIKRLISSMKCGSCGRAYREEYMEVVEHRDSIWFLKVFCAACHVGCLVAVIVRDDFPPALVTDLTEEELEKFRGTEAVREEDLLEMHRFLKDFNGDLPGLLGSGKE